MLKALDLPWSRVRHNITGIGAGDDSWAGSCWANANDKGPNRGDIAIDESFGWGATGYLLPSIDDMMTGALTFATRVLEHETTHWGSQFLLGNHDDELGHMLINMYFRSGDVQQKQPAAGLGRNGNIHLYSIYKYQF